MFAYSWNWYWDTFYASMIIWNEMAHRTPWNMLPSVPLVEAERKA